MCICTYIPLLNPKASALCFSFFILFYGRQSFQLQFLATAAACDVTNTHIQHTYKAWKMELDLSKKGAGIGGSGGVAGWGKCVNCCCILGMFNVITKRLSVHKHTHANGGTHTHTCSPPLTLMRPPSFW